MSFRDLDLSLELRPGFVNPIKDFYIPVLSQGVLYQRSVGYFSSRIFTLIFPGLMNLIKNGGKMQLIVSPKLSDEDIAAIEKGYEERKILEDAIIREFEEPKNIFEEERLNFLAHMIEYGKLDIKVAVMKNHGTIGMYHEKLGLVYDAEGNVVSFSGSGNETMNAVSANYDVNDVYCSWVQEDVKRVNLKKYAFDSFWNNSAYGVDVTEFTKVEKDKLLSYRKEIIDYEILNASIDKEIKECKIEEIQPKRREWSLGFKIPEDFKIREYQIDAVQQWEKNDHCGIFDMATGTGKTYTCLCALAKLNDYTCGHNAVIIVAPYQHLVEQWVEDIELFGVEPIVAYSESSQTRWKQILSDKIEAYNAKVINFFCVITTNATFSTKFFQDSILKLKENVCFVADEAHNMGAKNISKLLPQNCQYRLGLSATIERHRDEEGTQKILDYFGEKCIELDLDEAIRKGFLVPYDYYPVLVTLNDDELEEYHNLTNKINSIVVRDQKSKRNQELLEMLSIKRARIVAGAQNKIPELIKILQQYKDDNHMLIYCGATKYDRKDLDDDTEIKQIIEISRQIRAFTNMKVRKFTASESKEDRARIREDFIEGLDLQVITAIKCLDEGVNIPAIKRAFILASSTNPKEYVQRRGRVLRLDGMKKYAEIYDFITIPRPLEQVKYCDNNIIKMEISLVKKEINRMMCFANSARNPGIIDDLKEKLLKTYNQYNILEEDYYEL